MIVSIKHKKELFAHTLCEETKNNNVLSSRRASAQAVTLKRYIRTTSPVNTYSSGVQTDSRRKTGRSQAVYESIRKIPKAEIDRNFGAVADVDSVFSVDGRKRAVLAVFRALGGQNGTYTF